MRGVLSAVSGRVLEGIAKGGGTRLSASDALCSEAMRRASGIRSMKTALLVLTSPIWLPLLLIWWGVSELYLRKHPEAREWR